MMREKNKKKLYLILLILMLTGMGIGYAYLSTTINYNGTALINNASWNIYLDNIQVTEGSVTPTTVATINSDRTSVSYGVTLVNPGDFYEFTVDVKNDGSIDGMIESVLSKLNNVEITSFPDYLDYSATYSSGKKIEVNHLLKSTKSETYKIRIEFKKDITDEQLPTENQTLNFNFGVTFIQADENGVEVFHPHTIYTVNIYSASDPLTAQVLLNRPVSDKVVQYNTASDARANFGNKPFYLRHFVEEKVKESYVEFVVTEEIAAANEGMTSGTYALKGGDAGASYEENKAILIKAFGENNCVDYSSPFRCDAEGLNGRASGNSYGYVRIGDDSNFCSVYGSGDSYCG